MFIISSYFNKRLRRIKRSMRRERVRVLRNSYFLLALILAPTVLGAYLGLVVPAYQFWGSWITGGVFLAGFAGFYRMLFKYQTSGYAVLWAIGFALFLGYFLAPVLGGILGFFTTFEILVVSLGGAAGVFFMLAVAEQLLRCNFAGRHLFVAMFSGLFMLYLATWGTQFFWGMHPGALGMALVLLLVVTGVILNFLHQRINLGETNYVLASLGVFLAGLGKLRGAVVRILKFRAG